ncbi:MAG: sulfotransferase [Phycisphaeraceae bacterium]
MARLPDFLIIGAMKSGTTTLYHDLLGHPRVFFPVSKELNHLMNLTNPQVLTEAGREEYSQHFEEARDDQICGEASTVYTKRPDYDHAAAHARQLIGSDLRILYIIRDPIKRIVSQYQHEILEGRYQFSLDEAIEKVPSLINYSRYAMQLQPWMDTFGREAVKVIRFEDYIADRVAGCASALQFLGLDPAQVQVDTNAVYNKTEGKPLSKGWAYRLTRTSLYQNWIRPHVSIKARDMFRRMLLPKAEKPKAELTPELAYRLAEQLIPDQEQLADMLGRDTPLWDLRQKYQQTSSKNPD